MLNRLSHTWAKESACVCLTHSPFSALLHLSTLRLDRCVAQLSYSSSDMVEHRSPIIPSLGLQRSKTQTVTRPAVCSVAFASRVFMFCLHCIVLIQLLVLCASAATPCLLYTGLFASVSSTYVFPDAVVHLPALSTG